MSRESEHVIRKMCGLGIGAKAAKLYVELLSNGPSGVVGLSRLIGSGRNVTYRLLDELHEHQLISISEKTFGKEYTAKQIEAFETIAADKESEATNFKHSLEDMANSLQTIAASSASNSRIVHFKGREGLKQVNWNLTKADNEYRVYEQSQLSDYLDIIFAQKVREKYLQKKLKSYDITNSKSVRYDYDEDFVNYLENYSQYGHIGSSLLDIQFEIYIYNDVVTLLDYSSRQPHCIEIHNRLLATMQKQIYDLTWSQAQPMKFDRQSASFIL